LKRVVLLAALKNHNPNLIEISPLNKASANPPSEPASNERLHIRDTLVRVACDLKAAAMIVWRRKELLQTQSVPRAFQLGDGTMAQISAAAKFGTKSLFR
jgi:hypothetical protein